MPFASRHILTILPLLFLLMSGALAHAEERATHNSQYRQGWAVFGSEAGREKKAINDFIELYRERGRNDTIIIEASASPEGTPIWLTPLARRRGVHLRSLLLGGGIEADRLRDGRQDLDWAMLRAFAQADTLVPGQREVLALLDNTEASNAELIRALHAIEGGAAWEYLYARYFPAMRYSRARFPGMMRPVAPPEFLSSIENSPLPLPSISISVAVMTGAKPPRYLALKSNLVHDVLAVPNIGLEWAFLPRWSVSADYSGAWWGNKYRTHLWRYYGGNIEVKHYFGRAAQAKPLTGWHVGIYGELASYDFQFGRDGYQGRIAWGTGAMIGYMLPISRHFNIDFGLGLGYFGGRYKKCRYTDGHEVWTGTYFRRWWGPTRLEVSLSWLLGRGNVNKNFKR